MGFYQWFDKQTQGVKIILLIPFWGWIFSFLYRLDKFIENKDVASLIGFVLSLVIGYIIAIIDIVTVAVENKILILVSGGENFGINGKVDSNTDESNDSESDEK